MSDDDAAYLRYCAASLSHSLSFPLAHPLLLFCWRKEDDSEASYKYLTGQLFNMDIKVFALLSANSCNA